MKKLLLLLCLTVTGFAFGGHDEDSRQPDFAVLSLLKESESEAFTFEADTPIPFTDFTTTNDRVFRFDRKCGTLEFRRSGFVFVTANTSPLFVRGDQTYALYAAINGKSQNGAAISKTGGLVPNSVLDIFGVIFRGHVREGDKLSVRLSTSEKSGLITISEGPRALGAKIPRDPLWEPAAALVTFVETERPRPPRPPCGD